MASILDDRDSLDLCGMKSADPNLEETCTWKSVTLRAFAKSTRLDFRGFWEG